MLLNITISLILFGVGMAFMPHPLLAGGNETISDFGIYGGVLFGFLAWMNWKNIL